MNTKVATRSIEPPRTLSLTAITVVERLQASDLVVAAAKGDPIWPHTLLVTHHYQRGNGDGYLLYTIGLGGVRPVLSSRASMESHAFASLAQIRILLLPVGPISHSTLDRNTAEIRAFSELRLRDIQPTDSKGGKGRFIPNPLSSGCLHLCFTSHPSPRDHERLFLFRPSHFTLGVIGIAACSQKDLLPTLLTRFNTLLLDIFPSDSPFPLAKNLFVFEETDGETQLNLEGRLPGISIIPSAIANKKLYIGRLLADLCSHVLGEFDRVVQTLETRVGNEHLNATLLPSLPSSAASSSLDNTTKRGSPPTLPSHSSQPELTVAAPKAVKRNSSANLGTRPLSSTPPLKKRSIIGAASGDGRLYSVLGNFFLLAGRTGDAMIWYEEAIALCKSPQDAIWHASALEGMATVPILDAWSSGLGIHAPVSGGDEPWSGISDKLLQAISLYSKGPPFPDPDQPYALLAYLYCCAVLRQASLLFAVWSAKGWGPLAFATMLHPSSAPYLPPTVSDVNSNTWPHLERLSTFTGISRSFISSTLTQAHGPWLLHLGPAARLSILESMAAMYACLGYKRKEVYLLREVLGSIVDLVVQGREEDEFRQAESSEAKEAVSNSDAPTKGSVSMQRSERTGGNESLLNVLKYVSKILGVNLEALRIVNGDDGGPDQDTKVSRTSGILLDFPGDESQDPHGWPELQVGIVREAVAIAEALPDNLSVAQFSLSSLRTLHLILSSADQWFLYNVAARALATARRRGYTQCIEFWTSRPVVNISVSLSPSVQPPVEKPISVLAMRSLGANPILQGATDPFLYNPRRSGKGQAQCLLVHNEPFELAVTLQNPFMLDVEFQGLTISASGVPLEMQPISVTVPASSVRAIAMVGTPLMPGRLIIRGCILRTLGSAPREFLLPLSTDDEEERLSQLRSASQCKLDRSKYSGLASRPWERPDMRTNSETQPSGKSSISFLECNVVPEQPLLRIRGTSLTHGALMLYNGEMSTIRFVLENVSTLPIDFFTLSFDDDTIAPSRQALADGNLSVFEAYETEYDLIHRPLLSQQNQRNKEEETVISPGQAMAMSLTCTGKVGCSAGTIHVSYAYIHRTQDPSASATGVFHCRQFSYSVVVTVYHMLECHAMDILPYSCFNAFDAKDKKEDTDNDRSLKSVMRTDGDTGWCLFSIEVRNTYGLPFDVTFDRTQKGTPHASTTVVVPPGSTKRIYMPIKRFLLPSTQVEQAIPTLSDRQFVVTKSKLSTAEEKLQRELFWYREELFECLRGRWRESGGTRSGDLSLRKQRMTLPMLERLRTESVKVVMTLAQYDAKEGAVPITLRRGAVALPRPNEFLRLCTKVTNLSPTSLILTLSYTMDPADLILCEGVLTDIPLGRLNQDESLELETGICFLASGRFEIKGEVQCMFVEDGDRIAGFGSLRAHIAEE